MDFSTEEDTVSNRIQAGIEAMKAIDSAYWQQTLKQRLAAGGAGSIVDGYDSTEELEKALKAASWTEYSPSEDVADPACVYFKTQDLGGRVGVIDLGSLSDDSVVVLDDRKNTGKVSAVIEGVLGAQVSYIVAILGIENGVEVIFTFHPGEPVNPSKVQAQPGLHGKTVSVAQAMKMGLSTAKIVA